VTFDSVLFGTTNLFVGGRFNNPLNFKDEDNLLKELNFIREVEILSESEDVDVYEGVQIGQKVLFTEGSFAGWNGVVSELAQDGFVYVNILSIQASIKLKYPAAWCSVCEE